MTCLVNVEPLFVRQTLQEFLIGLLQRLTHLGNDVRQLATRDRQPNNVADELADGGVRSVADSLEVGDQGRQLGTNQAAAFDADGQRRLELLLTVRAPPWMTAMLLDLQRHVVDVDLLDHPGQNRRHRLQVMAATGTEIEAIVDRRTVDRFRREGIAFVLGVTRLSADAASILTLRRLRLGRLDDVGGRRLGGGRGVLPCGGKLRLETCDDGLERLQPRLLGIQHRLQAPTIRARLPCLGFHG